MHLQRNVLRSTEPILLDPEVLITLTHLSLLVRVAALVDRLLTKRGNTNTFRREYYPIVRWRAAFHFSASKLRQTDCTHPGKHSRRCRRRAGRGQGRPHHWWEPDGSFSRGPSAL